MSLPTVTSLNRLSHLLFFLVVLMCAGFISWAYYGELDIVSVADGQVIPSGKIRHIQHYEGGIIQQINVREGDEVTAGQPLIELEQIRSGASLEEIQLRINALTIDIIRYTAIINDQAQLTFSPDIEQSHPGLVKEAKNLFSAHNDSVQSK
ncbi:MAG: biotin/lipoyl-binding protein, partial [Desulfotignum sp.]|nr:biotin/lipoyl-binding protein [Desulfotignum sp.]